MLRNPTFTRIIACALAVWTAATPPVFAAYSVSQAFNGLLQASSASGPGYYTTGTRGVFVGGSLRVWTPSQSVQLVSLTPPSIEAGCGGISMFFGGFSFINGSQFASLVQNLMQVAEGYAIEIGIRALCPMCADVLAEMHNLANAANTLSQNNCAVAKALLDKAAGHLGVPTGTQPAQNLCAAGGSATGLYKDYLSALSGACSNIADSLAGIGNWIKSKASGIGQLLATDKASPVLGNRNWVVLTRAGYADTAVKELILSVIGDTSKHKDGSQQTIPGWVGPKADAHALAAASRHLIEILLFGPDPAQSLDYLTRNLGSSSGVTAGALRQLFAQAYSDAENGAFAKLQIVRCQTDSLGNAPPAFTPYSGPQGGTAALHDCDYPEAVPIGQSQNPLIAGPGLIAETAILLQQAVYAVATDQAIAPQAIALMQVVPLPIYRMINVAAVYPAAAAQLVHTYSTFIAILTAQAILRQWTEIPSEIVSGVPNANIGAMETMQAIATQIGELAGNAQGTIGTALGTQDKILASLQTINNVIYQQMSGSGVQGNLLFTQGLASGMAQGH